MSNIATTIEQSKKLIELGLNTDTADMFYYKENIFNNALSVFNGQLLVRGNSELKDEDTIPAWSLSRLLELMPNNTSLVKEYGVYTCWSNDNCKYTSTDSLIDAAYVMMCYLLENKLIK